MSYFIQRASLIAFFKLFPLILGILLYYFYDIGFIILDFTKLPFNPFL